MYDLNANLLLQEKSVFTIKCEKLCVLIVCVHELLLLYFFAEGISVRRWCLECAPSEVLLNFSTLKLILHFLHPVWTENKMQECFFYRLHKLFIRMINISSF